MYHQQVIFLNGSILAWRSEIIVDKLPDINPFSHIIECVCTMLE